MSRKLWVLPVKFGDGATPVRPLPKVRIAGADQESVLAHLILDAYAGQISQFHMAAAHNYHLAPQAVFRARRDLPDVKMQYTNIHGQEIIDVAVSPEVRGRLLAPPPRVPWDWLLIDLDFIPPTYTFEFFSDDDVAEGFFKAKMRFPTLQDPTEARNRFIDDPDYVSDESPPVLQFAGSPNYSVVSSLTGQPVRQVSSLLVDIRRFPTVEEIIIDLWGGLTGFSDDVISVERLTGSTFAGYVDHSHEHNKHFIYFRNGYSLGRVLEVYPEFGSYLLWTDNMAYDPFFDYDNLIDNFPSEITEAFWATFNEDSTGYLAHEIFPLYPYLDEASPLPVDGGGLFRGKHRWREFRYYDGSDWIYNTAPPTTDVYYGRYDREYFHMPVYTTEVEEFQPPADALADLRAIAFRGTPSWRASLRQVQSPWLNSYYQWEFADMYPERHTVPIIARDVPLTDSSTANNPKYLGSVHFFQKDGAFIFKPA